MSDYLEPLFSLKGHVAIVRGLAQCGAIVCGTDKFLKDEGELEAEKLSANYSDRLGQNLIAATVYLATENSSLMRQDLFLVGSKLLTKQI